MFTAAFMIAQVGASQQLVDQDDSSNPVKLEKCEEVAAIEGVMKQSF